MRILLHIGPERVGADRLQTALDVQRKPLAKAGVLVPKAVGNRNHTRLFMAVTDPEHIDPLRFSRGYAEVQTQQALRTQLMSDITREVEQNTPDQLVLSASQLGTSLHRTSELHRLRDMLAPLSDDIRIVAHVDEPSRLLARYYAHQIMDGRSRSLQTELDLTRGGDWWNDALAEMPPIVPSAGQFEESQAPAFWLDFTRLVAHWESVFGAGSVDLRAYDPVRFNGIGILDEIRDLTQSDAPMATFSPDPARAEPSAAWLARAREINLLFHQLLKSGQKVIPRKLWRALLAELAITGAATDPASLAPVSARFAEANAALTKRFPALQDILLTPPEPRTDWVEADPQNGFRATQYLLAFMHRIDVSTREAEAQPRILAITPPCASPESPDLPPAARATLERLRASPFAPHNKMGTIDETSPGDAFAPRPSSNTPGKSNDTVIVGCMKNEAPYILEWVAYHRAIGVDNFLIYSNNCEDGTDAILNRLQDMGILQHRSNNGWKGNSPQQHALNRALKEPVIRNASWIIHIDVDEFINIRCGNGTLEDLFKQTNGATNIAMTWRLFGHNGMTQLDDRFVIDQFDMAAPKYCPKPHTTWGFKSMFRNIGAYDKISCHRPNKLGKSFRKKVKWVNGSGQDMTPEAAENGWRNSKNSIGYDLVQLNHYALRSADSFLIKRQRGRALHVDRSIGLNYWIRMDWSDHRDLTIKRNIPRLKLEFDRLMQDDKLRDLHESGMAWHRAKAEELHSVPEFDDLYHKALSLRLSDVERAAYALTLDMES